MEFVICIVGLFTICFFIGMGAAALGSKFGERAARQSLYGQRGGENDDN